MLLQVGAGPNCRDAESDVAMASEEGRTVWTALLQDRFIERCSLVKWTSTVKISLKYGADPTARCYMLHGGEDRQTMDVATPETIVNAVLADKPQYKNDLAEVMELLNKIKANRGIVQ